MQLLVSYLRFVPHKTEIMQALLSFPLVNRFLAGKANRKVSYLVQKIMCECVYESKYQTNSNALEIYIYVITAGISDGPSTQHKGPRGHIQCILVGRTKASQECGQILVKHALLFKKVPQKTAGSQLLARKHGIVTDWGEMYWVIQLYKRRVNFLP